MPIRLTMITLLVVEGKLSKLKSEKQGKILVCFHRPLHMYQTCVLKNLMYDVHWNNVNVVVI